MKGKTSPAKAVVSIETLPLIAVLSLRFPCADGLQILVELRRDYRTKCQYLGDSGGWTLS